MVIKDNEFKKKILNTLNDYEMVSMFIKLPKKISSEFGRDFDDADVEFQIYGDELHIYKDAINVDWLVGKEYKLSELKFEVYRDEHWTIIDLTSKVNKGHVDFERIYVSYTNDFIGDKEIDEETLNILLEKLAS